MPVESLKSRLEGNQLDLSLSSLTTVPVKELAALPKATSLDLSCNLLSLLPLDFCTLTHIVKLDLSQNQLEELPGDFGRLAKLQHLDLYQNRLQELPISFSRLNALKWLDLRDNPLHDEGLVQAAGDCLNKMGCQTCAKQVVAYLKKLQSDQERERQKQLQVKREQLAAQKAEEEREILMKREKKKAEKEQRRIQLAQKAAEAKQSVASNDDISQDTINNSHAALEPTKPTHSRLSCCQIVLAVLLITLSFACGLYIYCTANLNREFCFSTIQWIHNIFEMVSHLVDRIVVYIQENI